VGAGPTGHVLLGGDVRDLGDPGDHGRSLRRRAGQHFLATGGSWSLGWPLGRGGVPGRARREGGSCGAALDTVTLEGRPFATGRGLNGLDRFRESYYYLMLRGIANASGAYVTRLRNGDSWLKARRVRGLVRRGGRNRPPFGKRTRATQLQPEAPDRSQAWQGVRLDFITFRYVSATGGRSEW
jgi:hypothetical protein